MTKVILLSLLALWGAGCANHHEPSVQIGADFSLSIPTPAVQETAPPQALAKNKAIKPKTPAVAKKESKPPSDTKTLPVAGQTQALAKNKAIKPKSPAVAKKESKRPSDTKTLPAAGQSIRQKLISIGKTLIGIPYRYGGTSKKTGFDCSGLVQYLFEQHGYRIPRTSRNQFAGLLPVKQPKPGDLVFFRHGRNIGHVGLYLGNRKMLHAPSSGKRISIVSIDTPYWKKRYAGARSVIIDIATAAR